MECQPQMNTVELIPRGREEEALQQCGHTPHHRDPATRVDDGTPFPAKVILSVGDQRNETMIDDGNVEEWWG